MARGCARLALFPLARFDRPSQALGPVPVGARHQPPHAHNHARGARLGVWQALHERPMDVWRPPLVGLVGVASAGPSLGGKTRLVQNTQVHGPRMERSPLVGRRGRGLPAHAHRRALHHPHAFHGRVHAGGGLPHCGQNGVRPQVAPDPRVHAVHSQRPSWGPDSELHQLVHHAVHPSPRMAGREALRRGGVQLPFGRHGVRRPGVGGARHASAPAP